MNKEKHILKFKPDGPLPVAPHNMPLWNDLYVYFTEFFTEFPDAIAMYYPDAQSLIDDLQGRFNGKYDVDQVAHALKTDCKLITGKGYQFLREEYIKPVTL